MSKEMFHILLTANQQYTDDNSQRLQVHLKMLDINQLVKAFILDTRKK